LAPAPRDRLQHALARVPADFRPSAVVPVALAHERGEYREVVILAERFAERVGALCDLAQQLGRLARVRSAEPRGLAQRCQRGDGGWRAALEHFGDVAEVLDAFAPLVHGERLLAL